MISKNITVNIKSGLGATPVAMLVQVASRYTSRIYIEEQGKRVNAKSIMGMMTLGLNAGESLSVSAEGDDENDAVNAIEQFLNGEK